MQEDNENLVYTTDKGKIIQMLLDSGKSPEYIAMKLHQRETFKTSQKYAKQYASLLGMTNKQFMKLRSNEKKRTF